MLAPMWTGDPAHPPALYKLPDELWLLILSHIPALYPWHSSNLGYDDAFGAPSGPAGLKTTFQAENRFVQGQFRAWMQTMEACLCVCSAWYVELRPSLDEWVLFRNASELRAFLRARPPVEHLAIRRVDVHYDECYPDALVQPFLGRCTALEQLHLNQLNNYLSFDVPLSLLDVIACTSARVQSIGFPKRGIPAQSLELLARLPGLETLSVGADKCPFTPAQLSPYISSLSTAAFASVHHLRIDLPVLSRASDFLFNHLPATSLPALHSLVLSTVETPFRMPSSAFTQPFSARVVEPFFLSHGPKLRTLQFTLAEPQQHGHLCRLAAYCPSLQRLALPACEHTHEAAPAWSLPCLEELAVGNFMQLNPENALQISDHWRNVVGLVLAFTAPASAAAPSTNTSTNPEQPPASSAFPSLRTLRLADVLPWRLREPSAPEPWAHQMKLARKVEQLCSERGMRVVDCTGGPVGVGGRMAGRWPQEGGRVKLGAGF
ncbi:hypothetical protein CALVIDRAFT_542155 [Calocera viscosa TUFC12733]|uniref:F-box domain-containing protein n=1 Tax=Calocera viscosa (strain TUFC12733) TaxID=1330018 RepID=A0A167GWX7_CALVF|nr:hypothetical protein CALVIDRAFT_542155 [Calocera viscosa TUFC12733]